MKKIIIITITMVFTLVLGAYAKEAGRMLYNGITDFTGRSVDSQADLVPAPGAINAVESSNAGGPRSDESGKLYNGITDFTGRSVDSQADLVPAPAAMHAMESSNAGGPRSDEPGHKLYNGITDFTGRSVDSQADLW